MSRYENMLYTIGCTKNYEKFFVQQGCPKKLGKCFLAGKEYEGGSVWMTYKDAVDYLSITKLSTFSVYGILCEKEDIEKLMDKVTEIY